MTRRPLGWAAGLVLAVLVAVPAVAATTTAVGGWTLGGSSTAYTGTMQLPALGFPQATFTSTASSVSVPNGSSAWFGANTPPGQVFGSSQNRAYLSMGTRSDAGAGTPSTTTYTFAAGTPPGWGLVLGDIDADQVQVSATSVTGSSVPISDLGFAGAFSICATTPRPSPCVGTDVPTWDGATGTLRGSGSNTDGAAGWFRPTVPLRTLTLVFTRTVPGIPSYQTWFAVRMQDLTGTVTTAPGCDPTQARVALVGPDGTTLATTAADATGHYGFAGVSAGAGYTARLDAVPTGCVVSGAGSVPVDLSSADATADFAVTQAPVVTGVVGGSVEDTHGDPVAGAVLHLRGAVTERAETGEKGDFRLPPVAPGEYTVTLDPPDDLTVVGEATRHVVVGADGQTPRLDFVVRRPATAAVATGSTTTTTSAPTTGALPEVGSPVGWWTPLLGLGLVLAGVSWSGRRSGRRSRPGPA